MRSRQLALYKTVALKQAEQIWQGIAQVDREATLAICARLVARAAKQRGDADVGAENTEKKNDR